MPYGIGKNYYEKHVKALEANLAGTKFLSISFDQLIEAPDVVIEQIESFITQLSDKNNRNDDQPVTAFIDSALRHHRLKPKSRLAPVPSVLSHVRRRLKGGSF